MKHKRFYLVLLLLLLAAADQIGIDWLHAQTKQQKELTSDIDEKKETKKEAPENAQSVIPDAIRTAIEKDLQLFPIPTSTLHPEYEAAYEDSWMYARTFGGERGHEGTDIMLTPDTRGLFPVLSMTDGVVEKKGWLPQGGYRIGIRSERKLYYYYAHLADYAEDIEVGTPVKAGTLLGFAGDTGYSEIEGTTGNFPVHLHVGIYYDDAQGAETAVNPYEFLRALQEREKRSELEF